LHVFVYIKLSNQTKETLTYLEGAVKMNSRVQDCFRMTGDYDYALRLLLKDTSELEYFLTHELSRIPHIASIRTEVAMKCIKQDSSINL
jgi:DNA-binding Lrp family transcriptional regulator